LKVHEDLPRQGPGSAETTLRALNALPQIKPQAHIYDMGCGPGHAALILARTLQTKIIAVDLEQPFLDQLQINASAEGLSHLIETRHHDMLALSEPAESIDLIWAEGSIYCAGFDKALQSWWPILAKDGLVACTELSWLNDKRSQEAQDFWHLNYPQARSIDQNIAGAVASGYMLLGHFILPETAWWDEYYNPILTNIERLTPEAAEDQYLAAAISEAQTEIDLYRHHSADYGYVFYLLKKSA